MIETLKKTDRTLLEMHTGMLVFGLVCQLAGFLLAKNQRQYAVSLWVGVALAVAGSIHMARTLDRALPQGANASRTITMGYLIRYVAVAIVFAVIFLEGTLNPVIVFLGYMSLKVTAYLQPITHKLYNRLFHETDPVPQDMPEEETVSEDEAVSERGQLR